MAVILLSLGSATALAQPRIASHPVPVGSVTTKSAPSPTPALTRSGSALRIDGATRRLSGANMYWLGLNDNTGGSPAFASHSQITDAMAGAKRMGVSLVRAHTIGVSTGTRLSYSPAAGSYRDANLDAADWAVYQAKLNGIYLMVPLTDNWNYYHGGKWNFVHWAYQQNPSGIIDTPGAIKDDVHERIFFADSAAGHRVRALFKDYIAHWLNHVNPYTGLAYKNDPTVAIVETGNEIYNAAQRGTNEWTQDICSYVKSRAPGKLLADGAAASGQAGSTLPGLSAPACDVVGGHYYPADASWRPIGFTASTPNFQAGRTAVQQLAADVSAAKKASKVFLLGEYPWTRSDVASWYAAIERDASVSGDLAWSFIAGAQAHGGAFGSDDYPVHRPYLGTLERAYAPALARHISVVSGVPTS